MINKFEKKKKKKRTTLKLPSTQAKSSKNVLLSLKLSAHILQSSFNLFCNLSPFQVFPCDLEVLKYFSFIFVVLVFLEIGYLPVLLGKDLEIAYIKALLWSITLIECLILIKLQQLILIFESVIA